MVALPLIVELEKNGSIRYTGGAMTGNRIK
jgi:hypothetical protein